MVEPGRVRPVCEVALEHVVPRGTTWYHVVPRALAKAACGGIRAGVASSGATMRLWHGGRIGVDGVAGDTGRGDWATCGGEGSVCCSIPGTAANLSKALSLLANSSEIQAFCCLSCSIVSCCTACSLTAGVPGVVGRGRPAKSDS